MSVKFEAETHSYKSVNPDELIDWMSVTSFVSFFKPKFDAEETAKKVTKNKKSKWYGIPVETILEIWESEAKRATDLGTFYHNEREADVLSCESIKRAGVDIPIISPIYEGRIKIAPKQRLTEGIYPEHFVYLKSASLCGQSDRVEVIQDRIDIYDYKTNKEIKKEGFKNWEGRTEKMLHVLSHLDNCNFYHYALQLSCYMYIMLKHNPRLKAGKMYLHHIIFENEGVDAFGYPVTKRDDKGNPIVKEVVPYEVPYLKSEVINMINFYKDNKHLFKK